MTAQENREKARSAVGRSEERTGARSEERGGCIAPPNAKNFGEEVEPVVLDSLSSVASAPGVGAARATPSRARRTRSPCLQEASPSFS